MDCEYSERMPSRYSLKQGAKWIGKNHITFCLGQSSGSPPLKWAAIIQIKRQLMSQVLLGLFN